MSLAPRAADAVGRQAVFGLYDTDGILRYVCKDKEACLAYAELFDLHSIGCSLMVLPEPNYVPTAKSAKIKNRRSRLLNQVKSSN